MMDRKKLFVPPPAPMEALKEFEKRREQRQKNGDRSSPSPLPVEFCLVCGGSFDDDGMCPECGIAP